MTSDLSPADVTGTWAGLRPLIGSVSDNGRTQDLSRRHRVTTGPGGMITVTGGKLTTYRRMAADTVRAVLDAGGDQGAFAAAPRRSPTRRLPLWGAGETGKRWGRGRATTPPGDRHLENRYGTDAEAVRSLVDHDPDLGEPLAPGLPYLRAEVVFAARHEMAGSVDDVLTRRTRARLVANPTAAAAAADVASLLARELGWDMITEAAEVAAFQAACTAERRAAGLA
jgi:glycerol-3-phosphate dehydrogenase